MDARSSVLGLVEMIDWNINFGHMLTIGLIVGGWAWTLIQMKNDGSNLKREVAELKIDVKKFGAIVTDTAVMSKRLDHVEDDIHVMRKDINELRHGEGFVRGARGIDREFP